MLGDLALRTLALVVYPGGLLVVALGLAAELAAALALGGRESMTTAARSPLDPRTARATAAPLVLPAVPLALLAATQLAIPFNPVPPVERNLLVAAVALAGAIWLGWARA